MAAPEITFEDMQAQEAADYSWLFADNDSEDAGEPYAGTGRHCIHCNEEEGSGWDRSDCMFE